jgi:hypothetical protein
MSLWLQVIVALCGMTCTAGTLLIQGGHWAGRTEGEGRRLTDQIDALRTEMQSYQTETMDEFHTIQRVASVRHSEVTARIGALELDVRELKTVNAVRGLGLPH